MVNSIHYGTKKVSKENTHLNIHLVVCTNVNGIGDKVVIGKVRSMVNLVVSKRDYPMLTYSACCVWALLTENSHLVKTFSLAVSTTVGSHLVSYP